MLSDFVSSVTLSPTFKAKIATAGPVTATYGVSFPLELEIAGEGEDGREALLRTAEMALERVGVDGAACVRRAQCEAAGGRLARHGLVGEMLDLFLRGDELEMSLAPSSEFLIASVELVAEPGAKEAPD
ncbi:hypothetical protein HPB49_011891 [Dermacentor silvarum]|uniref:Uncharacterized protein n=1 Tax=Dermacentor silvarum TaxID=543639 RepID=A0ACB8CKS2_DERSI|nr:hypothetical protein HPB49_011891 [Dermacentor silvarum]